MHIMTNKLSRMLSFIKVPLLLSLLMFMGVNVSAQQVEEPKPGTYFDLQVYRDDTGKVMFQAGSDSCGFLRNPIDYEGYKDPRFLIFTNKKFICVSERDSNAFSGISAVEDFDILVVKGKCRKGKHIVKDQPRGYKVVETIKREDNGERKFELKSTKGEPFSFIIAGAEDWDKKEGIKMTISGQNQEDITMTLNPNSTTTCSRAYAIGDILNLKLARERRALIRSIVLNEKELSGRFILSKDKKERKKDDIVHTTASLNLDSFVLDETDNNQWTLKVTISYFENGKLKDGVCHVVIPRKVEPVGWTDRIICRCSNHTDTIIICGVFICGVFITLYYFLRKKTKKKKRQEDEMRKKEEAARLKEEQDKNKRPALALESDEPKIEESVKGNQKEDTEIAIASESDKCFEHITNADAAQLLKDYLKGVYGENVCNKDKKELEAKIFNSWVAKFCKVWNSKKTDNVILESQFTVENIFLHIDRGYIKPVDKQKLEEELREYGSVQDTYFALLIKYKEAQFSEGLVKGCEDLQTTVSNNEQEVCNKLKNILSALKEQHFTVKDSSDYTVDEFIESICVAIRQGMQQDELQNKVNELEGKIESMVEAHEAELNNKDTEKQIEQDTLREQFQEEKQEALKTKEREYEDKIKKLNREHQKAITGLNKAQEKEKTMLTNAIDKLNSTIIERDGQIAQLKDSLQDDCLYFINEFCKQVGKVDDTMKQLVQSTSIKGGSDSKCANIIKKAQESFAKFNEQVEQSNSKEHWLSDTVKLPEVIADLQNFIEVGLRATGWVNIVSYLHLYAGATTQLNESFNEEGLSTYQLNSLFYDIVKLIGLCGVKIMLPNLLVEKYNDEYFSYENADQWIQTFSLDLRPRDYASKVFDMSRIGYQIDGKEEVKAKVYSL